MDLPFIRFSFDLFLDGKSLPKKQIDQGVFFWKDIRPSIFKGVNQCLAALAGSGNHIIFDHIIETESEMISLVKLLSGFDVFVSLSCSLEELERREIKRGDRSPGEARKDFISLYKPPIYDLELSSENAIDENVKTLVSSWKNRKSPSAFQQFLSFEFLGHPLL